MIRALLISFTIASLSVSCTKEPAAPNAGERLIRLMDSLPTDFAGWKLQPRSGGSGTYGQSLNFTIKLEGASHGEAVKKLRSAIEGKLDELDFHVIGSGSSSSGGDLTGFSITVSDRHSAGTLVVSAAEISEEEMIAVLAVAQIGTNSEQDVDGKP